MMKENVEHVYKVIEPQWALKMELVQDGKMDMKPQRARIWKRKNWIVDSLASSTYILAFGRAKYVDISLFGWAYILLMIKIEWN